MKQVIASLWEKTQTSLWPIPTAITAICLILGRLTAWLDEWQAADRFLRTVSLNISRSSIENILMTLAGSVIGVGGVTFSVTMVAMTLASGQFGPKVLREFLSSYTAKITLGLFIGTFVYCVAALLSLQSVSSPALSLLTGVALAMSSLFLFVQFIHQTALSIQADRIVHQIGSQLQDTLREFVGQRKAQTRRHSTRSWRAGAAGLTKRTLCASESGYIESIDYHALVDSAAVMNGYLSIPVRAGQFIVAGQVLCRLFSDADEISGRRVTDAILLGSVRSPVQDPEFAIAQLNQLAARALSPGINDPGTAITCVDWFSAALAVIIDQDLPNYCFTDHEGTVRVIGHSVSFQGLFNAIYIPLRQHGRTSMPVLLRILESMGQLALLTERTGRRDSIRRYIRDIEHSLDRGAICSSDYHDLQLRLRIIHHNLNSPPVAHNHLNP